MDIKIILRALGEPMRYTIYSCLLERKHCVRSLSKKLGISESAISQHMKVLREAGLVYGEKYGYHTHYLPTQEAADFLHETFQQIQQKSHTVDRDMTVCQCEFRKENQHEETD
ncbi:MAG: winged helix-turn-helix transcriptional regulator [Clostridiaceae bacterium]|jgi:ArsR family transcriptional regulator|nr:winged helix-turn-helix transcriptional regulator [Clostridiaceae bacterium]